MRVFSYLGLLAAIVIMLILAVLLLKGINGAGAASPSSGEQKAAKQLQDKGEEPLDTKGEIQDAINDAYKKK